MNDSEQEIGFWEEDDGDVGELLSTSSDRTPVIRPDRRANMLSALLAENARLAESLSPAQTPAIERALMPTPGARPALRRTPVITLGSPGILERVFALLSQAHEARFAQVAAAHPKMAFEEDPLLLLNQDFPQFAAQRSVDDFLDPVFVVGFPRSGTTLLEQLLDAHPALQSFDEQPFLQKCILRMQDMGLRYPAELDQLSLEQLKDFSRAMQLKLTADDIAALNGASA